MRVYSGFTLDEWREKVARGEEVPPRILVRIERSDAMLAAREALIAARRGEKVAEEALREAGFALPAEEAPRRQREKDLSYAAAGEMIAAAMTESGEKFFRECGAIDAQGNYHFTKEVLSGLFKKAVIVVNHHLDQGNLDAAKLVFDKVVPEAQKAVAEMDAEELRAAKERVLAMVRAERALPEQGAP